MSSFVKTLGFPQLAVLSSHLARPGESNRGLTKSPRPVMPVLSLGGHRNLRSESEITNALDSLARNSPESPEFLPRQMMAITRYARLTPMII